MNDSAQERKDGASDKRLVGGAIIALATLLIAWFAQGLQTVQEIENRTWDWRLRIADEYQHADPRIKIIVIDQAALDARADDGTTWPWPRSLYVPVIKFLEQANARAVAFDLLFTESSAHSHFEDAELAEAAGGKLPVVVAAVLSDNARDSTADKFEIFRRRQETNEKRSGFADRFLRLEQDRNYRSVILPLNELLERAAGFGNVTAEPDSDGTYRHYVPGGFVNGVPLLGLPFALFDAGSRGIGEPPDEFERMLDSRGRLTVNFRGDNGSYEMFNINAVINSYVDVLEGKPPSIDPQRFTDSYVFVGTSAPALMDLRPTPLAERYNGVEYNATVLDNLLHKDFVRKAATIGNLGLTAVFVVWLTFTILGSSGAYHHIIAVGGTFLAFILIAALLGIWGIWVQMAIPLMSMGLTVVAALGLQYQLEGRQHRFIKNAFRYYVSPGVIDRIVADPRLLTLGGEKRELTLFFSDIVGFTSISERIEPTKLVALINTFLSEMTDIILQTGGTVDKYVGDAIVAFWNAPVPLADHAERAVRAALACQRRLDQLAPHFQSEFGVGIRMRVGLNTGVVTVGNFGSRDRFNYTVIGDAANLGSRLEGANKYFGTSTLIAQRTYEQLAGVIACRKVAVIRVVGKVEPVAIYEPLGEGQGVDTAAAAAFERALEMYERREIDAALEAFMALPQDPVARVYVTRLQRDIARAAAGDNDWDSVWSLTEK